MTSYTAATIYRRKKDGVLLVQQMWGQPGEAVSTLVGDPELVPLGGDAELFAAVSRALDQYYSSQRSAPPAQALEPKFFSRHDCVSVTRYGKRIEVVPMERHRGMHQSIETARRTIPEPDALSFGVAVRAAFGDL